LNVTPMRTSVILDSKKVVVRSGRTVQAYAVVHVHAVVH